MYVFSRRQRAGNLAINDQRLLKIKVQILTKHASKAPKVNYDCLLNAMHTIGST
jgi:hypothetical protein